MQAVPRLVPGKRIYYLKRNDRMKKFVALVTLILGAALTLTAFDTVEEPEPECVCGAAGPLRNKTVEEQELERFLKEFPYKIFFVERWILIVASEKYHNPECNWSEKELYESERWSYVKSSSEEEWSRIVWPITDFAYEKGYEYVIEGICIDYSPRNDDVLDRTFKCCRILSRQKKQSENLPR